MLETASNFYISKYYHLAVNCGLDADALLEKVGLTLDIIDVPGQRVDAEKLGAFLVSIGNFLQDESMSLSKSPIPLGSFYMMGKLTIHEPNLYKSLEQIMRFYKMVTKAFTMELRIEGNKGVLTFEIHYPEMDKDRLFAELYLMSWHRYSSWLIAESIPMNEVYFSHPAPPHVGEYTYLFPGKHIFNAPFMGFSFPKKYLDCEIAQNDGSMKLFMRKCPVQLFLKPTTDFSLTGEIQSLLRSYFKEGFPTIETTADQLHLTKRTLMRKLKEEGTSFQQIKDLVRRDRAISYLTRYTIGMEKIAEKVGFSDPAVFARAFRSWTGLSPREYRAKHAQIESSG